jgi:transcription antitermination factor NusG
MKEINKALNGITSSLITKSTTLTLTNNAADLPSDFESIIEVVDKINIPMTAELDAYTYKITVSQILAQGDTVTLSYRKSFPVYVFSDTITPTTIDLPVSFDNMLIDGIVGLLTGKPIDIKAETIKLIANRDGKKRPQRLIFNL